MENLVHGLTALGSGPAIAYLVGGALLGMIVGAIPGLSTVVILSIILVFTYHIDLTGTLCLFLGAQCGSFYSASISAILLNTPGHPEAFPITLDGYPMARNGQPGRALGLSACSTCVGGFLGCAVAFGLFQVVDNLVSIFHPPEFIALVTLALLMVGTLGTDSVAKAIVSAGTGLLLATIGPSPITDHQLFTFGAVGLVGGLSVVALVLGLFAIPQMLMVFGTGTATADQDMSGKELGKVVPVELTHGYGREIIGGIFETFRHWAILLQSGIVGGLTGIVPGIGGFTGNFLSYGIARQTSRKRALYGTGLPDGIIAPEGSSLAKEAGHMIPLIGLGIPGGVAGALFLAALSIQNVRVGYAFQTSYPNVTGEILWIIALSGLIGTAGGLLIGPQIARVTRVPGPLLVPFIFAICITGPFLVDVQFFSVVEVLIFTFVGLAFRRLRYPVGALVLGLVLGPTFQTNIYLTRNIYPGLTFLAKRPLADGIFFIALAVMVLKALELRRESRALKASLAAELEGISNETERAHVIEDQNRRLAPYPLLGILLVVFMIAVSTFYMVYAFVNYNFTDGTMAIVGAMGVLVPSLYLLPRNITRYVRFRRSSRTDSRSVAFSEIEDPAGGPTPVKLPAFAHGTTEVIDEGSAMTVEPATSTMTSLFEGAEALSATMVTSSYGFMPVQDKSWGPNGQYRREAIAFAWLIGLTGLCWLFGFPNGAAIFMVLYGLTATRRYFRTLWHRVTFAALSAAAIWLLTYEMFTLTHLVFHARIQF